MSHNKTMPRSDTRRQLKYRKKPVQNFKLARIFPWIRVNGSYIGLFINHGLIINRYRLFRRR